MAAGVIAAGRCVDASAAVDLYYSSAGPSVAAGSTEFITQLERTASGWFAVTYSGGSVVNTSTLQTPAFAACDTAESFYDGLQVGWGVALVMVGAYAVHLLRRGMT